jgi:hypothetical protein
MVSLKYVEEAEVLRCKRIPIRRSTTKIPRATIREFDGHGHQFDNDLSEVGRDIKGL